MVEPLRHRQTKGAETDMSDLQKPRHISTLPFVSGLGPEQAYVENVRATPAFSLLDFALRYEVDRTRREVTTTIAGSFVSRAVFRDGLGCLLVNGGAPPLASASADLTASAPGTPPSLPEIAGPAVVTPASDA